MSIANVTLTDTFAEWIVKTNQLIVQSGETNTLAVASFNIANSATFTAANMTANILSTNSVFINSISNQLVSSGNLANVILSNTIITNTIYTNANTIVLAFNSNSNLGIVWNTANAALANTTSYNLTISDLTITGNVILSGTNATLNLL